jgi:hypothetical protein
MVVSTGSHRARPTASFNHNGHSGPRSGNYLIDDIGALKHFRGHDEDDQANGHDENGFDDHLSLMTLDLKVLI